MDKVTSAWRKRAVKFGDTTRAVMEQSFPSVVNAYIHSLHVRELCDAIPQTAHRCLDVGCGWGRVAEAIITCRDVSVWGIDPSDRFIRAFNKRIGKKGSARIGDMRRLPFRKNSFDVVYTVASFMYLENFSDQKNAIHEMLRVLKPGGTLILIEPGTIGVSIFRFGGLLPYIYRVVLRRPKVETFGTSFSMSQIEALVADTTGRIDLIRGYPILTIFLFPLVLLGTVVPAFVTVFLRVTHNLDAYFNFPQLSYFITWKIHKDTS